MYNIIIHYNIIMYNIIICYNVLCYNIASLIARARSYDMVKQMY